jgi:cell division protein FtsZ
MKYGLGLKNAVQKIKNNITMADDIMNFDLPVERSSIIKVLGVGGGGNNAVNHMFEKGIRDVNFVVCNTDHQALIQSRVPLKVQIGESLTEGRGAGSKPEVGRNAAIENIADVMEALSGNTKMVQSLQGCGPSHHCSCNHTFQIGGQGKDKTCHRWCE